MLSTVGLEVTSSINLELSWKAGTKERFSIMLFKRAYEGGELELSCNSYLKKPRVNIFNCSLHTDCSFLSFCSPDQAMWKTE